MKAALCTAVLLALSAETTAHFGAFKKRYGGGSYGGMGGRSYGRPASYGMGGHGAGAYGGMGGHGGGGGRSYGWKKPSSSYGSPAHSGFGSEAGHGGSAYGGGRSRGAYGWSRRGQQLSAPIPDVPLADCAFPGCGACHPTEGAARSCTCPAGQFFGCNGCWPSHEEASSCNPCPAGRYLGCGRCWTTPEQADAC